MYLLEIKIYDDVIKVHTRFQSHIIPLINLYLLFSFEILILEDSNLILILH